MEDNENVNLNNTQEENLQPEIAQMYNGDAYVDPTTGLTPAQKAYGENAPVEELGCD